MSIKEQVLILYYDSRLKTVEIAQKLQITQPYVSKIIKQDPRYATEKQTRKEVSKQKQKDRFEEYINNKRNTDDNKRLSAFLEMQHNQAASELSFGGKTINNRNLRKWCAGAYNYNNDKNRVEFDNSIGRSYAMPKNIKLK